MSQSVSAQDLFRLKSVTQPTVAAGQVVVVENRVDQASNSYLSALICKATSKHLPRPASWLSSQ